MCFWPLSSAVPRWRSACADGGVSLVVLGASRTGKAQTHGFLSVFNSSQKHLGHMASRPGGHGTSAVSDGKTHSVCCYAAAVCICYSDPTGLQPCNSHYYRLFYYTAMKSQFRLTRCFNSKDPLMMPGSKWASSPKTRPTQCSHS